MPSEKGVNVFMEKPTTVDGPTQPENAGAGRRVGQEEPQGGRGPDVPPLPATASSFTSASRTAKSARSSPCGHTACTARSCYFSSGPKPNDISELLYQVQRFHSFLWASGGAFSDFYIHGIDECCWMKDAWPVEAQGQGGRHYRGDSIDQNFDNYSVEYTFADGTKLFLDGRTMAGCYEKHSSYAHGTKGSALISMAGRQPTTSAASSKGRRMDNRRHCLEVPQARACSPYQQEWEDLIDAIRQDKPYNEAKRGAEASLVTAMGRMAAHTGRIVTYDEMLHCDHELAPDVDKLAFDSPRPIATRLRGEVSGSPARHRHQSGILIHQMTEQRRPR